MRLFPSWVAALALQLENMLAGRLLQDRPIVVPASNRCMSEIALQLLLGNWEEVRKALDMKGEIP